MMQDAMNFQRHKLEEMIESHTQNLVRGAANRDDDQRIRGIIYGLKLAVGVVNDLEDRLRKASEE